MLTLHVTTLTVAGLLVGNEFAIAAFVHPTLNRLPDHAHAAGASALARLLGRVMPFWYALATLLACSEAALRRHETGTWPSLLLVSAILWMASIVYTILALVPINNRVASWSPDTLPTDWKSLRTRWDQLHRWRVLLLFTAWVLLTIGILKR